MYIRIAFDDFERNPESYIWWKLILVNEHFCYKLLILHREWLSWLLIVMIPILFAPSWLQNVTLDSLCLFYVVNLPTIFLVKFNSKKELAHLLIMFLSSVRFYMQWSMTDCFKDKKCIFQRKNYSIKWLLELKTINRGCLGWFWWSLYLLILITKSGILLLSHTLPFLFMHALVPCDIVVYYLLHLT